jgi:cytochrome c oxidase subunit 2
MTAQDANERSAHVADRAERLWATVSVAIIVLLACLAAFAGIRQATMPQARVETADPARLHLAGEFIESNLGSSLESDGSVTVRGLGQQYSFTPQCILVPSDTPVTMRLTSPDVVHGLLIQGTNFNTMLIPGYVSVMNARFASPGEYIMPCQEFCGVGHEGMWGKVRVVAKADFAQLAAKNRRLTCVE